MKFISSSLNVQWQTQGPENHGFGTLAIPTPYILSHIVHKFVVPQLILSWSIEDGLGSNKELTQIKGDTVECCTFEPLRLVVEISNRGNWTITDSTLRIKESSSDVQGKPKAIAWTGILETIIQEIKPGETSKHLVIPMFLETGKYCLHLECSVMFGDEEPSSLSKTETRRCNGRNEIVTHQEIESACKQIKLDVKYS